MSDGGKSNAGTSLQVRLVVNASDEIKRQFTNEQLQRLAPEIGFSGGSTDTPLRWAEHNVRELRKTKADCPYAAEIEEAADLLKKCKMVTAERTKAIANKTERTKEIRWEKP